MFDLDSGLPAEVVPLAWLLGVWEGTGVLAYRVGDEVIEREFGQRVAFTQDGGPHVQYAATSWLLDDGVAPEDRVPLYSELGFWRLARQLGEGDPVRGSSRGAATAGRDRRRRGDAPQRAGILRPRGRDVQQGGVAELYLGTIAGARVDLGTDAVVRAAGAKEYAARDAAVRARRQPPPVGVGHAALGQDLRTHASGRLART